MGYGRLALGKRERVVIRDHLDHGDLSGALRREVRLSGPLGKLLVRPQTLRPLRRVRLHLRGGGDAACDGVPSGALEGEHLLGCSGGSMDIGTRGGGGVLRRRCAGIAAGWLLPDSSSSARHLTPPSDSLWPRPHRAIGRSTYVIAARSNRDRSGQPPTEAHARPLRDTGVMNEDTPADPLVALRKRSRILGRLLDDRGRVSR